MTEDKSHHQGSFLTGFTVGLFAGAASFYLFGTDKGKKLTDRLSEEWENAKERLADEGVIDTPDLSFRQVVGQVLTQVKDKIEEAQTTTVPTSAKSSKTAKVTAPKTPKKPVKKFKNISL